MEEVIMHIWQTFLDALCKCMHPIRQALPVVLVGTVVMTLLLLAGTGLVLLSRPMDQPFDLMAKIAGEVLMVAGALAGLATTVWAWWLMFKAVGFLEKRP